MGRARPSLVSIGLALALIALVVPSTGAGAAAFDVGGVCAATGELTPSGAPIISDPMLAEMTGIEIPLAVPAELEATPTIAPGGTITYDGTMTIDAPSLVELLLETLVRPAIVEAGYPALAGTAWVVLDLSDMVTDFPYPPGTTGVGTPVVTSTGPEVEVALGPDAMLVTVPQVIVDSRDELEVIEIGATWSVQDGGTAPPATLDLLPGHIVFDLDLTVGVLFFDSPVTGQVAGPWSCEPNEPAVPLVTTEVVGEGSDPCEPPAPGPFLDVAATHAFCGDIVWASDGGIVEGYADGTYGPTRPITRQALAAMLHRMAGSPAPPEDAPSFTDVPADHLFATEIAWLASEGITGGYADGSFQPTGIVSRQALAAMLHRMAGSPEPLEGAPTFTDVPGDHLFATEIAWLASEGITVGDAGLFRPGDAVSRQSVAAFLHRYADL